MSDWAGIWTFAGVAHGAADRLAPAYEQLGLIKLEQAHGLHAAAASFATPDFEDRVSTAQNQFGFAMLAGKLQSPELNPAQHALDLYVREPASYQTRLNGTFALLLYDRIHGRLHLVRDPVGTIPIYYTTVGPSVMFATRIAPLLDQRQHAAPNARAVAELFLGGRWFAPGETLYAGVCVLAPGHALTLDVSGLTVSRYWSFPSQEIRSGEASNWRAEFHRLFQRAVQTRLGARRTAVFVSGGLDSSAVYAIAHKLLAPGSSPHGITWATRDGSPTDESHYVTALEAQYGQAIERIPLQPTHDATHDDDDIRYGELPIVNNLPDTSWRAHAAARSAGADVVLDGGWADHLLAPFPPLYLVSLIRRLRWIRAVRSIRSYLTYQPSTEWGALLRQIGRAFLRQHSPAWLLNRRRAHAITRVDAGPFTDTLIAQLSATERWPEWLPAGGSPHARSVLQTVYHPAHALRYESGTKMTALYGIEAAQPFLDRDVIAFLATMPGDVHSRDGVPKAILRDSMVGVLPELIRLRNDKGDYTLALRAGIEQRWARYKARIEASECAYDWRILEPGRVQAKLARLEQQRQIDPISASWSLIELYGLVVWLEVFFGAGKTTPARRHHERVHCKA